MKRRYETLKKMKITSLYFFLILLFFSSSCHSQIKEKKQHINSENKADSLHGLSVQIQQFIKDNPDDGKPSVSKGLVSNGSLINGKLLPYSGSNYQYFADNSYLMGRAFVHSSVKKILIDSYAVMEMINPNHRFYIMETSNKNGGKLDPHKTHQNGLSVDFMMPLLKEGKEYVGLDTIGTAHYFLNFDDKGNYSEDSSIQINFEIVAKHILELDEKARENGMRIEKVIIKLELKDELYTSKYGDALKTSGIYIVKSLTPVINQLHDEHYHVDFGYIK